MTPNEPKPELPPQELPTVPNDAENRRRIREMRNEELRWELENEPRDYEYSKWDYSDDSRENGPRR